MSHDRAVTRLSRSVAAFKKDCYSAAFSRWMPQGAGVLLKTDTFEDADPQASVFGVLCGRFTRVVANDISFGTVRACRASACAGNAAWLCADASAMALKDSSCDAVFAPGTFSYLPRVEDALKESYRVLKPGGALIAAVLNPWNAGYGIAKVCRQAPVCAGRAYGNKRFTRLLRAAGFEVTGRRYLMAVPAFLNSICAFIEARGMLPVDALTRGVRRTAGLARACRMEKFSSWLVMYRAMKPQKGPHA